jgi:hypothetical protein
MKAVIWSAVWVVSLFPTYAYGESVTSFRNRNSAVTSHAGVAETRSVSRRPIAEQKVGQTGLPFTYPTYPNYGAYPFIGAGFPSPYGTVPNQAFPTFPNSFGAGGFGAPFQNPAIATGLPPVQPLPVTYGPAGFNNFGTSIWNSPFLNNRMLSSPTGMGTGFANNGLGWGSPFGFGGSPLNSGAWNAGANGNWGFNQWNTGFDYSGIGLWGAGYDPSLYSNFGLCGDAFGCTGGFGLGFSDFGFSDFSYGGFGFDFGFGSW